MNTILKILCLSALLAFGHMAYAQDTLYWLGSISTDWTDPDNWGTGPSGPTSTTAPSSTTTAIIQSSSNDCVLDDDVSVASIEIETGAVLNVSSNDLEVSGNFKQFGGTFYGQSSPITIGGSLLITDGVFYSTTGTLYLGEGIFEQYYDGFRCSTGTVRATGDIDIDMLSFMYRLEVPTGTEATLIGHTAILNHIEVDGAINTNLMALYLDNTDDGAVSGTGGVYIEVDGDFGMFIWRIGENTGTYSIPVLTDLVAGEIIPFKATVTEPGEGVDGRLLLTGTAMPSGKPQVPFEGFSYSTEYGADNSERNINRVWGLVINDFDVSPVLTLGITYNADGLDGTNVNESLLVGQANLEGTWEAASGTVDIVGKNVTVTGVEGESDIAQFWTLVDNTSPNYNVNALYWTGDNDNDWHNGLNWSYEPCGDPASEVPDNTTTAVFNGCANNQAVLSANASVDVITYTDGYSYSVDEASYTLTVGDKTVFDGVDITVTTGTVNLGNDVVLAAGSVTVSGGATLVATGQVSIITGAEIEVDGTIGAGSIALGGGYIKSTGTLILDAAVNISGGTLDADDNEITVDGNLTLSDGIVSVGNGVLSVTGEVTISNGSFTLLAGEIVTTGNLGMSGGTFSGGSGTIDIEGNLALSGGLFASTSGTLTLGDGFTETSDVFRHGGGTVSFLNDTIVIDPEDSIYLDDYSTFRGFYNIVFPDNGYKVLTARTKVSNQINLGDAFLALNSNELVVNTSQTSGLVFDAGGIISESTDGKGRVVWRTSENTGLYEIPFHTSSGDGLLITVDLDVAGTNLDNINKGYLSFGTYPTNSINTPYPGGVEQLWDETGSDDFASVLKRFWLIDNGGYLTDPQGDLSIQYTDEDLVGTTLTESDLMVQSWLGTGWSEPLGSVNTGSNTITLGSIRRGVLIGVTATKPRGLFPIVSYAEPSEQLDGSYYRAIHGVVYFKYDERYIDGNISYYIYDWQRNIKNAGHTTLSAKKGINWFAVDVSNLSLTNDEFYVLELHNMRNEILKLRFKSTPAGTLIVGQRGPGSFDTPATPGEE